MEEIHMTGLIGDRTLDIEAIEKVLKDEDVYLDEEGCEDLADTYDIVMTLADCEEYTPDDVIIHYNPSTHQIQYTLEGRQEGGFRKNNIQNLIHLNHPTHTNTNVQPNSTSLQQATDTLETINQEVRTICIKCDSETITSIHELSERALAAGYIKKAIDILKELED